MKDVVTTVLIARFVVREALRSGLVAVTFPTSSAGNSVLERVPVTMLKAKTRCIAARTHIPSSDAPSRPEWKTIWRAIADRVRRHLVEKGDPIPD